MRTLARPRAIVPPASVPLPSNGPPRTNAVGALILDTGRTSCLHSGVHHKTLTAAMLVVSAAALFAPGCASGPAPGDETALATPPSDFTLAFTVLTQPAKRNIWTLPREQRLSRFVIETDWVLRGFSGPSLVDESFPRETRQLNEAQITSIWNDLAAAGLLDPSHPSLVGAPPMFRTTGVPTIPETGADAQWIVTIPAEGDRRMLILTPDERTAAAPLLHRLSDLAWLPE